jgi:hypothetical protein
MVDVALSEFDYVVTRREVHYARLHKVRADLYWLTWGGGEIETCQTVEQAVKALERITEGVNPIEVKLQERR